LEGRRIVKIAKRERPECHLAQVLRAESLSVQGSGPTFDTNSNFVTAAKAYCVSIVTAYELIKHPPKGSL
jgi:hypothetical protein